MTLDIHAHLYPLSFVRSVVDKGGELGVFADRLLRRVGERPFMSGAIDRRLEIMASTGIDRQVLSMPNHWVLDEDVAKCGENARLANDALAEVCSQHPDRFRLFVGLPYVNHEAALRELDRAVTELRPAGLIMPTHVLGHPLDWAELDPVYAEAERRGLPIFLHPAHPYQAPTPAGFDDFGLTVALYFPMEDATAVLRLVCSGVLERHPDLRIICPHLGGAIPFIFQRIDMESSPRMPDGALLPHPPTFYLQKMLYDTASIHGPALRCSCDTLGPQHLAFGTDFPYLLEPEIRQIIQTIDDLDLTEAERAGVLHGNAEQWLAD